MQYINTWIITNILFTLIFCLKTLTSCTWSAVCTENKSININTFIRLDYAILGEFTVGLLLLAGSVCSFSLVQLKS